MSARPEVPTGPLGARIRPVEPADRSPEQVRLLASLGPEPSPNLFSTAIRNMPVFTGVLGLGRALTRGSLSARQREIVILRVAWRCSSRYEWGHHTVLARGAGLTTAEVTQIAEPPERGRWTDTDRLLLEAVDGIVDHHAVPIATWERLARDADDATLLELTFLVGYYVMLAGVLRSTAIELEEGLPELGHA